MPRLGQLLVRQGWASPDAISRALTAQSAGGGRLGTSLLENRVLSEDLLLKALSELHHVPGVGVEDLRDVPEDVISALPARLAQRCCAVPFRAFGTQVHVAMLDPRDLNCQDELAFALGKRVRPFVATEVRLREALAKHYGVPLEPRLENLAERLDRNRYRRDAGDPPPAATAAGARTRRLWEQPEAALFSEEHTRPAPRPVSAGHGAAAAAAVAPESAPHPERRPSRRRRPAPRPVSVTLTEQERRELDVDVPAPEPSPRERSPSDEADDTRPVPTGAPPIPPTFGEMEERLGGCDSPEEVGELLTAFLGQQFERVALFKVLRDRAVGWMAAGPSIEADAVRHFVTDFTQPSIFLNLRTSGSFYLGRLPPMAAHKRLARAWGGPLPGQCLVLPIRIRGRLVTAIYLDRGPEGLGKLDLDALLHLAVTAGEAYERCILRKKKD